MTKKVAIILVIMLVLILLIVSLLCKFIPEYKKNKIEGEASLFVNGKEMDTPAYLKNGEVYVSIVCVLKGYGFDVAWEDEFDAKFLKNERVYLLNLREASLVSLDDPSYNLIAPAEGGTLSYYVVGNDIMVCSPTMIWMLFNMGENPRSSVDRDNMMVKFFEK